jgi:multiple sugar transport system substrate-binding protein
MICLFATLLSGCDEDTPTPGTPASEAPAVSESVEITFAHRDFDTEYFEALVEQFSDLYPNITINLLSLTEEGMEDLESGVADVRPVWPGLVSELVEQGELLELDPMIERDGSLALSDFYPATLDAFTLQDKIWAIPLGANPVVIYYNQDLFDQHEIPYPEIGWTWDDFLNAALEISDPDAGIFGYVSRISFWDALLFVHQHGGQILNDIQNPTQATLNHPLTIEAMEWYAALYHEHNVAPTLDQENRILGGNRAIPYVIAEGRVGMWSTDFSRRGGRDWPAEWRMRWGVVALPRDPQATTIIESDVYPVGFAISSQTEQPDVAGDWVSFLSRQTHEYVVPARRSIAESLDYTRQLGRDIAAVAQSTLEHGLTYSPAVFTTFSGTLDIFEQAVDRIIAGTHTAREAMEWAQSESEEITP